MVSLEKSDNDKEEIIRIKSKDWEYINEGNLHMCFYNNTTDTNSTLQDKLLKIAKTYKIDKTDTQKESEEICGSQFNEYFLGSMQLSPYLTKEIPIQIDASENPEKFILELMRKSEGKRADCRLHQKIQAGNHMSIEKNLLYLSDKMLDKFSDNQNLMKIFHVEIKPKFCKDEIPKFESIQNIQDKSEKGRNIDQPDFYKTLFKDASGGARKFVYRKSAVTHKKFWKKFNPTDFFSDNLMVRAKSIRALLKEDWGYLRIFDKDKNTIQHSKILEWFREFDPQLTYKAISILIAVSIDLRLIKLVASMQELFPFNTSELLTLRTRLEQSKHKMEFQDVKQVIANLKSVWLSDPGSPEFKALKKTISKEFIPSEDYQPLIAFLISLTARDCSFMLRIGMNKKNADFEIIEEWEKLEDMPVIVERVVSKNIYNTGVLEKDIRLDGDMAYWIKGRNHIIDVGLKDWHKLYEVQEKIRDVNEGYVEYFLDKNYDGIKKIELEFMKNSGVSEDPFGVRSSSNEDCEKASPYLPGHMNLELNEIPKYQKKYSNICSIESNSLRTTRCQSGGQKDSDL